MSETSEDKTRRRYLAALTRCEWSHQYSVFYADPKQSTGLLTDMVRFKQVLRRRYPEQPFLIRIQMKSRDLKGGETLQAYLTIFAAAKSDGLKEIAKDAFKADVNVQQRRLTHEKLKSLASAINNQKPHDLSKVFGSVRIRRWSVLNRHLLDV